MMQQLKTIIDKYSKWALLAALVIIFFLWQRGENFRSARDIWKADAEFKNQQVEKIHNQYGQEIAQQKTAITSSSAQMKELSAQVFGLSDRMERKIKEVQALVKIQQRFIIRDTVYAQYTDTTNVPGDSLVKAKDVIIPPRSFSVRDSAYSISGKVLLKSVQFDSISIPNNMALRIAEQKNGWFKARRQIVQVINSNRYIQIEGMQSITLQPTVSAWNKWIKPLISAIATFFITTKIN